MTQILEPPVDVRSRVYLLVQTDPGRQGDAHAFLQEVPGVVEVSVTSGPFDLVVVAEAAGPELSRLLGVCRRTPGLARISRCEAAGT